jgi:hypothetical protein
MLVPKDVHEICNIYDKFKHLSTTILAKESMNDELEMVVVSCVLGAQTVTDSGVLVCVQGTKGYRLWSFIVRAWVTRWFKDDALMPAHGIHFFILQSQRLSDFRSPRVFLIKIIAKDIGGFSLTDREDKVRAKWKRFFARTRVMMVARIGQQFLPSRLQACLVTRD